MSPQRELDKWKAEMQEHEARAYFDVGENDARAKWHKIMADYCRYYVEKYTKFLKSEKSVGVGA